MSESIYRRLRQRAIRVARVVEGRPEGARDTAYLLDEAKRISAAEVEALQPARTLAEAILEWMADYLDANGSEDRTAMRMAMLKTFGPLLWERLMCEAPLGLFAQFTVEQSIKRGWLAGNVCELGAGVGNLSRLISETCTLTRTDSYAGFLDKRWSTDEFVYDFDQSYKVGRTFSSVVSVNAIHCARDRVQSLKYVRDILKPGGRLVLCEGRDTVLGKEPTAINLLFYAFAGWIECGGFASESEWQRNLKQAGYSGIEIFPMMAGPFHLGNLIGALRD